LWSTTNLRWFTMFTEILNSKDDVNLLCPKNYDIQQPILYEINQETEAKSKSNIEPTIDSNDKFETVKWSFTDIPKGETFRIEW